MRRLERLLLGLLSSVVTVFIACAYGIPFSFQKTGRVRAAGTQDFIDGIRVSCADPARSETICVSGFGGYFNASVVDPAQDCSALRFEDVDGSENGGAFQPRVVTGVAGEHRDLDVELDPVP